jgi:hypothetical protein
MLSTETLPFLMDFSVVINKALLLAEATNTMTNATGIAENASNAGKSAAQVFNNNWLELAGGKSYIYLATVRVSLAFATILIAFWSVPFFNTIINEGYSKKTIDELVYPLLIVLMLAINNGSLLSNTSFLFRNASNYVNNQVLSITINGVRIEQAIRQSNMNQSFKQQLSEKVMQCNLQSSVEKNQEGVSLQNACIQNAIAEVSKSAKDYNAQNQGNKGNDFNLFSTFDDMQKKFKDGAEAIAKIPAQYVNSAVQGALLVIFLIMQTGFVFLIEIAFLINAYIAPIFLALSLLPSQTKLIHVWLSGWLALSLVKISYTLIIGIATTSIVNVPDTDPLLLPLLLGVLSPVLALAIASGGAMALFNGLSDSTFGNVRLLLRAFTSRRRTY